MTKNNKTFTFTMPRPFSNCKDFSIREINNDPSHCEVFYKDTLITAIKAEDGHFHVYKNDKCGFHVISRAELKKPHLSSTAFSMVGKTRFKHYTLWCQKNKFYTQFGSFSSEQIEEQMRLALVDNKMHKSAFNAIKIIYATVLKMNLDSVDLLVL